jgi:uncharacterized protein YjbI with pentapeptide repeats
MCAAKVIRENYLVRLDSTAAETAATVTRTMLTLVGFALFCILTLLTPDVALLPGGRNLNVPLVNVPLAGPVSIGGFMLIGPFVLIVIRLYLEVYVQHYTYALEHPAPMADRTLVTPHRHPFLRGAAWCVLYVAVPFTMGWFVWKDAVRLDWDWQKFLLLCATAVVTAYHIYKVPLPNALHLPWSRYKVQPLNTLLLRSPRLSKALLSVFFTIVLVSITILLMTLWYKQGPLSRPFNLHHADLSKRWLPNEDLASANLELANLKSANLGGANLRGANLVDANFEDANLRRAHLQGANLRRAHLQGANLRRAHLEGAKLKGAHVKGAKHLRYAYLKGVWFPGAKLQDAYLDGAYLEGAYLKDANLSEASLWNAKLSDANLAGALLSNAQMFQTLLTGAHLEHAYLDGAILMNVLASDAHLEDAFLVNAMLDQTLLDGADLDGADLRGAHLKDVDLEDADLEGADLEGAKLVGVNLRGARNLTQEQLDAACIDKSTKLPPGYKRGSNCARWHEGG